MEGAKTLQGIKGEVNDWCWIGHTLREPDNRRFFQWNPQDTRNRGGPKSHGEESWRQVNNVRTRMRRQEIEALVMLI